MSNFIRGISITLIASLSLTGCLVRTQTRERTVVRERSCPPAHHWDDGRCVHNGHGHGDHDHDKDGDHDHGHKH